MYLGLNSTSLCFAKDTNSNQSWSNNMISLCELIFEKENLVTDHGFGVAKDFKKWTP